jgi:hypothetical protein
MHFAFAVVKTGLNVSATPTLGASMHITTSLGGGMVGRWTDDAMATDFCSRRGGVVLGSPQRILTRRGHCRGYAVVNVSCSR